MVGKSQEGVEWNPLIPCANQFTLESDVLLKTRQR